MLLNALNIVYLLVSIAMVGFILLQRGPGATAGSGFGAGASATVFGARGSANFLSRSTAVLALLFFALSLGMAVYVSRSGEADSAAPDLGVMSGVATAPADGAADADSAPGSEAGADMTSVVADQVTEGEATATVSTDAAAPVAAEVGADLPEAAADAPQEDASEQ